jgi:vancomycin permeability regulator SanA
MLKKGAIVLSLWIILHSIFIIIDGLYDRNRKADVAVVMGNKVNENGALSPRLEARLNCAYDVFKEGRVKAILVSGGFGDEGSYEAEVMKTFLVTKGVPDSVIFVDNMGFNTQASAKNAIQPAWQQGWKSIMVVSQYFHITRAKMFFRKEGFEQVDGVGARYFELRDFYAVFREFWAFYIGLF